MSSSGHAGISKQATGALARRVRGAVLVPGDDGYDEERVGYDRSVDHRPAVVVAATSAEDVVSAIAFARANGVAVAVQATGHGACVPADGAMLIATSRMAGVEVEPASATARVQAGARWERVIHDAAALGLAPLSGSAPFVGAVGYTVGGGLGVLARRYGYAADHVRALEVVTADGRLLHVTPDDHPDLFWGLRGGKDNLGIVTAMVVDLFPVTSLHGGGLFFAAEDAARAVDAYVAWTATVPDEMTSSIALARLPDVDAVPDPLRGRFVVHVRIAYCGAREAGDRLVAPLRAAARPILDTVAEIPYTASGTIHADPSEPVAAYSETGLLRELDHGAVEALLSAVGPEVDGPDVVELRHLGGALGRPPAIPNAIGHRDAAFTLLSISVADPARLDGLRAANRALFDAMRPWDHGGVFLNFLAGAHSAGEPVRNAYEPRDLDRLRALKAQYDPTNVFRLNHNIAPPTPGLSL
jgi:FAD/FMN-containing dehydrogenase